jgi:hypothetical protein
MKALILFIFPTVKAIMTVVTFMLGLGWGAYALVYAIAKTEAGIVRIEINQIRTIDKQHFDGRFDRVNQRFDKTDEKLDKILERLK